LVQHTTLPMFLHMPIGFEARLHMQYETIHAHGLHERWPGITLSQTGMFRGQLLCPLREESSPLHGTVRLSNPYQLRCRLLRGDMGKIKTAVRTMQSELLDRALLPKELFLAYLNCPTCRNGDDDARIMVMRHWIHSPKLAERIRKQQQKSPKP